MGWDDGDGELDFFCLGSLYYWVVGGRGWVLETYVCVYVGRYVGMCVFGGGEGGDGEVEIEVWEELIEVVAVSLSIDRGRRNSQDATPVIEGFHTRYVLR